MLGPEGGGRRLKTSRTSSLPDLAPDLILRIASLLEAKDVLSLRMCNKRLYSITQDEYFWRGLLRNRRLPLPRTLKSHPLNDLSHREFEKAALYSLVVEDRWLKQREDRSTLHQMDRRSTIHFLGFLDDRWILFVQAEGLPLIWDARENPPKLCELHESMWRFPWDRTTEARAAVGPLQDDITIVLRSSGDSTLRMLRVHLADPGTDCFQLTDCRSIGGSDSGVIALEPSRNAVVTGGPGASMQIGDWIRNRAVRVPQVSELSLGVRLVGNFILSFAQTGIGLLSIPSFSDTNGQTHETDPTFCSFRLKHQEIIFTGASLSEVQPNPKSPNDSLVVYVLAREAFIGFFYFRITIYNPHYAPSGPRVRMDVELLGAYELSKSHMGPRDGAGPRTTLGAWLGPEGKRGLWIEHMRDELMPMFVVAVSFDQNPSGGITVKSGDDLEELCEIAPRIELTGDALINESWDLNDIILECSFSEAIGKIVLGTAGGRIMLL